MKFTPEEDEQILRLRNEGWTYGQIGRRLNRNSGSVSSRMKCILVWQARGGKKQKSRGMQESTSTVGLDESDMQWMHYWSQHAHERRVKAAQMRRLDFVTGGFSAFRPKTNQVQWVPA